MSLSTPPHPDSCVPSTKGWMLGESKLFSAFWKRRGCYPALSSPPPLLYSSHRKGTVELQGRMALSLPSLCSWVAAFPSSIPPLPSVCRSLWLCGACCRGCCRGWGHIGSGRKEPFFKPAVTLQCLTWVQPTGGPAPVTYALEPSVGSPDAATWAVDMTLVRSPAAMKQ